MISLLALDVDGTLLDRDGTLPPARARALRRLTAAGVPVVLATGKIWSSIEPLWRELGLEGPHVCCNGSAVVSSDGRVLSRHCMDEAAVEVVVAALQERGLSHALYLEDGDIVTNRPDPALQAVADVGEPLPVVADRDGRGVLKVLTVVEAPGEGDLRGLVRDGVRVQRTGRLFLEWNPTTVSKGTGLREVAAHLEVDLREAVAAGDAENDLPMFAAVGRGVAVRHAASRVAGAADEHLSGDLTSFLDSLAPGDG